jgi:hypothetical protein
MFLPLLTFLTDIQLKPALFLLQSCLCYLQHLPRNGCYRVESTLSIFLFLDKVSFYRTTSKVSSSVVVLSHVDVVSHVMSRGWQRSNPSIGYVPCPRDVILHVRSCLEATLLDSLCMHI